MERHASIIPANANLLKQNPNTNPENGADAALLFRLDRTQANTADQNYAHTKAEQQASNDGCKMDLFPKYTGKGTWAKPAHSAPRAR